MLRAVGEWLLSEKLRQDPDVLRQSKRLIAFCLAMFVWVPVYALIYQFVLGLPQCAAVLAAAGLVPLGLPVLQRYTGSPRLGGWIILSAACATYTSLVWLTGGHQSTVGMWYVTVPMIAVYLLNSGAGVIWAGIVGVLITAFYAADRMGIETPQVLSAEGARFLHHTSLLGLALCTCALTVVFKWIESDSQRVLENALLRAEAADRAKVRFLANMSHELRTPMTAILGFAENLLDEKMPPRERLNCARTIDRNGRHLLRLINDILDLSRIEADGLEIEFLPCSPVGIMEELRSLMLPRAEAKGLSLDVEYAGAVPETIWTDPTRLKQILVNLVDNAVKFTDQGSIRLRVGFVPHEHHPKLRFEVADTGIGLAAEQIDRLFKPFSQVDASMSRRFAGSGLGLSISRHLAERLGGTISVRSEPGQGSTFAVSVETGPIEGVGFTKMVGVLFPERGDETVTTELPQLRCRILVAEDGVDSQRLLCFVLKKAGAEVVTAENGDEAVRLVYEHQAQGTPFDLILMDMQMPVLDGYQATARLRSDGCLVPIVALTAHAMRGDREKCLAAGCSDYVSKPIDRRTLLHTIAGQIQAAQASR